MAVCSSWAAEREAQELGLLLQQQLTMLKLSGAFESPASSSADAAPRAEAAATRRAHEELRESRVRECILSGELASCEVAADALARGNRLSAGRAVKSWRERAVETRQHELLDGRELAMRLENAEAREAECEAVIAQMSSALSTLHAQVSGALRTMSGELKQANEDAARLASIAVTAQASALQLLQRHGRERADVCRDLPPAGGW